MDPTLPASARETLAALRSRQLSARELIDATIERLAASTLGAVELLDESGARLQAEHADAAIAAGQSRALAGLSILVKDVIDVARLPTRGGTAHWRRLPERDADCVAALRGAGAIVLGKAHTNELAFGIDGRNRHRPPCENPHERSRLPGGSSSGPAVAVAAGLVAGALGTDTSGSIRVPAALCGVAGLRPTYGRISRRGALPLAPSYDVVGPLARSVADLRLLLDALLAGASVVGAAAGQRSAAGAAAIDRVAIVENLLDPSVCEAGIAAAVRDAAAALAEDGVGVESITIDELDEALAVHRDVQLPEAADSVHALGVLEAELGPEVRERVRGAREIGAERHARALGDRARIAAAIERALPLHGALLAPGCAIPPPPRAAREWRLDNGRVRPLRDALLACTVPLTQAPGPVLSVPLGLLDRLPVGAQLLARPGCDERLIELGMRLERVLTPPGDPEQASRQSRRGSADRHARDPRGEHDS
jgi:aspartyl-tRNA(Asn)/glutamyl-tRNA(Gln) amidotransferase subunit A